MPQNESADPSVEPAEPPISTYGRVAVRTDGAGSPVAHRPGEFLALGDAQSVGIALASWAASVRIDVELLEFGTPDEGEFPGGWRRYTVIPSVDVLALVRGLRLRGIAVQPNHVYFVTSLGAQAVQFTPNMFAPNMFAPNMFAPNMFAPNMFAPNMFAPNMFAPNMFAGGGAGGGGCCCPPGPIEVEHVVVPKLAARPTGAQPAFDAVLAKAVAGKHVDVHVIDVADPGPPASQIHATGELTGNGDEDARSVDSNDDLWADPALCHGSFVRSIVEVVSGVTATLWEAADPLGDIDDTALVRALEKVDANATPGRVPILNLSLSGYNEDDRPNELLAGQIATMIRGGWVIVAAAGNNASCRLAWPAALPDVVAVGALSDCAPAWFSNFGPWVDVSAPGVNTVGKFTVTAGKDEDLERIRVADANDPSNPTGKLLTAAGFTTGWATWSGTSFAAPFVAARIAKAIEDDPKLDGKQAVRRVVDDPARDWVPYYGRLLR